MPKITETPHPYDNDEAALMAALDDAFDKGTVVSHLTPARQAELQQIARNAKPDS